MALHSVNSYSELIALKDKLPKLLVHMHHTGSLASRTVQKTVTTMAENGTDVVVVDIQATPIASQLHVTAVPAVIAYVNGKEMNRTVGIQTDTVYAKLFEPKSEKKVILYKTPTCPWCNVAKEHLKKRGVDFTEIDVSQDFAAAQRLMQKSGQTGVPQIEIGDEIVVGADVNRIDQLLGV